MAKEEGFSVQAFQPDLGNINEDKEEVVEVVDALEKEEEIEEEKSTDNIGLTFACGNCHTVFTVQANITNCVYCGGINIAPTDCNIASYEILPFRLSYLDALDVYKKKLLKSPLAPFSLRGASVKKCIKKVYVPCSLYDLETSGTIDFIGTERIQAVSGAPSQSFESNYSVNFKYNEILTSNYGRIPDILLSNINNYNYSTLSLLKDDIWKDAYLINSSFDDTSTFEKVRDKAIKYSAGIVKDNIDHTVKKISNNQLNVDTKNYRKILVPIYYIHQKYNGKDVVFIINGQTGEIVGEAPIGIEGVVILSIVVFLIIFLLSFLIAYFA